MVAGSTTGDIFFPAEQSGQVADAVVIGQYNVIRAAAVPEPSSLAVIGLGSLIMIARRRR